MRISLLNDSFPPQIDGVANVVTNYAGILHQLGNEVMVAAPSHPQAADGQFPYPVVRYPSVDVSKLCGYRAGIPFAPKSMETLQQFHPEILHSHCPVISTLICRTLRSQLNVPLIFTYHTKFDIDIAKALRFNFLQKEAVRLLVNNIEACDEVWVVSDGAGENLRSLGYQGDYQVMRNGVDFPRGRASQEAIDRLYEQYRLPRDGRPVFLFVGRMMWYKGLRLILDALAGAKAQGLSFQMVLVGDGMDRPEIEAYADELGIGQQCLFTGAIQDRELLRTWYCLSHLFLFTSGFDTSGIVVQEAAACSLPSLLLQGSCAAEGVTHERNGLLVEGRTEAVTAILMKYGRDLPALRQIGENASRELYFSWNDSVALALERYQVVLDDYNRKGKQSPAAPYDELFRFSGEMFNSLQKARHFREVVQSGSILHRNDPNDDRDL